MRALSENHRTCPSCMTRRLAEEASHQNGSPGTCAGIGGVEQRSRPTLPSHGALLMGEAENKTA